MALPPTSLPVRVFVFLPFLSVSVTVPVAAARPGAAVILTRYLPPLEAVGAFVDRARDLAGRELDDGRRGERRRSRRRRCCRAGAGVGVATGARRGRPWKNTSVAWTAAEATSDAAGLRGAAPRVVHAVLALLGDAPGHHDRLEVRGERRVARRGRLGGDVGRTSGRVVRRCGRTEGRQRCRERSGTDRDRAGTAGRHRDGVRGRVRDHASRVGSREELRVVGVDAGVDVERRRVGLPVNEASWLLMVDQIAASRGRLAGDTPS